MNDGYLYHGSREMRNTYTFKEASNQEFVYNAVIVITSHISCSINFLPLSPCWLISVKMSNVLVICVLHCPCNLV